MRRPTPARWLLALLPAALLTAPARAQSTPPAGWTLPDYPHWRWQNPRPQGFGLLDVWAVGDSAALAVGERGTALRTADAGRTWQPVNVGTTNELRRITFATPQLGWIAAHSPRMPGSDPSFRYGPGAILRTTNGGQTWQPQFAIEPTTTAFKSVTVRNLEATSATTAWLLYDYGYVGGGGFSLGELRLRRTTNAGQTWPRTTLPRVEIREAQFVSPTTGFFVGYNWVLDIGYVYRTTDGGQTWRNVAPDSTRDYTTLFFTDPLHGWVGGELDPSSPTLYRTADGGQTWQPQEVAPTAGQRLGVGQLTFAPDGLHGTAFGAGVLLTTADGGVTWQGSPGAGTSPTARRLRASGAGWGVTPFTPDVHRTATYGTRWEQATANLVPPDHQLVGVAFPDPAHGWAYGNGSGGEATPRVLRTTRRGEPWQLVPLTSATTGLPWDEGVTLTGGAFPDADTAYLSAGLDNGAAGVGRLLRTTDGGRHWTATPAPRVLISRGRGRSPNRLAFANTRRGLLLADSGLFVTQDGGRQWRLAPTPPYHQLLALTWADAQTAYAIGDSLTLLRTTDGGLTWQDEPGLRTFFLQMGVPVTNNVFFGNVAFATATTGCVVGGSSIYRTTDGGRTWQATVVPSPGAISADLATCQFVSARVGWAVGNSRYRTTDGGLTWTSLGPWAPLGVFQPALVDTYNGWLVGSNGRIAHYAEKFIQADTAATQRRAYCTGDTLTVAFDTTGVFSAAEQAFRLELSNKMGRFRPNETTILPLLGSAAASPLRAILPATLAAGTRYRVRVIRTDSSVLGGDNARDLTIYPRPAAVAVSPADSARLCAGDSVQLTAPAGYGQYQWSRGDTTAGLWVRAAGTYTVQVAAGAGCFSPASAPVVVRLTPRPAAPTITVQPQASGIVVLTSSAATGNQWFFNGAPISGATGATYAVTTGVQSGSYSVQVTQQGCASPLAAAVPVSVLGGAEALGEPLVSMAPNPASEAVTLHSATRLRAASLLDLAGRLLRTVPGAGTGEPLRLPLRGVPAGTYLVRATLADGRVQTHRLVVVP